MSNWTAELPEDARQCIECRNWFEPKHYVASECKCTDCAKKR
jgi:hypothetical protein